MDWSKAKNILIAALLVTNLILGMAIYRNVNGGSGAEQEELKQNTILHCLKNSSNNAQRLDQTGQAFFSGRCGHRPVQHIS